MGNSHSPVHHPRDLGATKEHLRTVLDNEQSPPHRDEIHDHLVSKGVGDAHARDAALIYEGMKP